MVIVASPATPLVVTDAGKRQRPRGHRRLQQSFVQRHLPAIIFVVLAVFGHWPPFVMVNNSYTFVVVATLGWAVCCV